MQAPGAPCQREQAVDRRPQGGGEIIGIEVGADDTGTRALADHGCEPGVLATREFGDAFNGIGLVGRLDEDSELVGTFAAKSCVGRCDEKDALFDVSLGLVGGIVVAAALFECLLGYCRQYGGASAYPVVAVGPDRRA